MKTYADPEAQAEIDRLRAELDDLKHERDCALELLATPEELRLGLLDAVEWRARDDEKCTKELDRLRKQLRLAELDEAEMARKLVSCRKAGDKMVREIETLEAELDRLRKVLLAEWEKDRKTYAALMEKLK